jgi:glutaredoxin-dependent peroxiredoxin
MAIKVGDPAPSASLVAIGPNGPGKVSISDLKGAPALVLFFPLVNTGVCHGEMCSIRDSIQRYNTLKTRVVAISVDSPFASKYWAEKEGFTFEFWSDFNKEAINAFGTFRPELAFLKGVSNRAAFVLDKDGVVRYAWLSEDPKQLPNFDEIQGVLAKL